MSSIDEIALNFDVAGLGLLNGILALVIFGIALDLELADFKAVVRAGKPALLGLCGQFLLLPALTAGLVMVLRPEPSLALGLILVAACPGGTMSNFFTHLAQGNTALSVTMSAVSTAAATVLTPLNFTLWGSVDPSTRALLRSVSVDPWAMAATTALVLGLPLTLGLTVAHRRPAVAGRLRRPLRRFSLLAFAGFVVVALAANWDHFVSFIGTVAVIVMIHNTLALASGYGAARLFGLEERDRRAVAIELGIQNAGLGLVLIFDFFGGLGGMAIVAAWWGIWHLISGLTLGLLWSRRPPRRAAP